MDLFKDKKQALEELDQLLQEETDEPEENLLDEERLSGDIFDEDEPEEEPEVPTVIYHNYANDYGRRIYNTDRTDADLDDYSDQVYAPKKGTDIKLLIAIAFTLSAAILGVVIWWVIRYL